MKKRDLSFLPVFICVVLIFTLYGLISALSSAPPAITWRPDDKYITAFQQYMEQFEVDQTVTTSEEYYVNLSDSTFRDTLYHGIAYYDEFMPLTDVDEFAYCRVAYGEDDNVQAVQIYIPDKYSPIDFYHNFFDFVGDNSFTTTSEGYTVYWDMAYNPVCTVTNKQAEYAERSIPYTLSYAEYTFTNYDSALADVHTSRYLGMFSRYVYESYGNPVLWGTPDDRVSVQYYICDDDYSVVREVVVCR